MAVLHIDGRGPVLILVLVDVGLGRADDPESVLNFGSVLILVLVDVGLGHPDKLYLIRSQAEES